MSKAESRKQKEDWQSIWSTQRAIMERAAAAATLEDLKRISYAGVGFAYSTKAKPIKKIKSKGRS